MLESAPDTELGARALLRPLLFQKVLWVVTEYKELHHFVPCLTKTEQ